ncbi:hypothetical protein VPMG_00049 [Vibrio phage VBP32]|uniref:Uncharacterized protein n=2 Tax=Stoningtonvirus VBP47 TaxID=2846606 RepID=M4SM63_9CAUD|nr:hypothetical protein VPNG_00079 [Vibrio phage VBP47]YP_007676539.1 hypothetical protein VPMG_00049 [Vibrio phage VBP32]AGH57103.1 hypothetical protein VPNG_00079 [Vibrio phage VBP47]AGH57188.1 hypothetical protein VPMG_00049 [Vibrio phage VBP32]
MDILLFPILLAFQILPYALVFVTALAVVLYVVKTIKGWRKPKTKSDMVRAYAKENGIKTVEIPVEEVKPSELKGMPLHWDD